MLTRHGWCNTTKSSAELGRSRKRAVLSDHGEGDAELSNHYVADKNPQVPLDRNAMCQQILKLLFASVNLVMRSDVNRDYCVFLDYELETDSVAFVDRYAAEPFQLAGELVQAQRWVRWVGLEQLECLLVLGEEFRVSFRKLPCATDIAVGVDDLSHW